MGIYLGIGLAAFGFIGWVVLTVAWATGWLLGRATRVALVATRNLSAASRRIAGVGHLAAVPSGESALPSRHLVLDVISVFVILVCVVAIVLTSFVAARVASPLAACVWVIGVLVGTVHGSSARRQADLGEPAARQLHRSSR